MIKRFTIEVEGTKHEVEYESDIPWGDTEQIIRSSVDLSNIQSPQVKMDEYRIQIIMRTLKKAPFNHRDPREIRSQKTSTINQIMEEVMKDYPLAKSLGDWMTSFVGPEVIGSAIPSMDSAQPSINGIKKPLTDSQPSG